MALDPADFCGTNAEYGNVAFRNVTLRAFDQTTVYDESNTDKQYDLYEIDLSSQVHKQDALFIAGAVAGDLHPVTGVDTNQVTNANLATTTAISLQQRLQSYLLNPRRDFKIYIGSTLWFQALQTAIDTEVFANPEWYDVDNGPMPMACNVTEIVGSDFFNVEFKIRCAVVQCNPNTAEEIAGLDLREDPAGTIFDWAKDAKKEFGVLNNRWQVIETRDRDMMLTRIVAGKLRTRHPTFQPNRYKHLCLPPQPRNMQPISQEFVESTNGLEINYRMIYRQRLAAPPWPAIDWDATHREQVGNTGAANTINASVSITLKGSPGTTKESLLAAALQVCIQRLTNDSVLASLQNTGPQFDSEANVSGGVFYRTMTVIDQMDENVISVNYDTQRPYLATSSQKVFGGADFTKIGILPAVAAYAPAFDGAKTYLQGDIISDGAIRYRARKKVNPGGSFDVTEWEDVTAQIGTERDDRNGPYRDQWPDMQPYDPNTSLGQFANYWQNPCIMTHGMPNSLESGTPTGSLEYQLPADNDDVPELESNNQLQQAPQNAVFATSDNYVTTIPLDTFNFVNAAHKTAIYTEIQVQNKYRVNTGQYGLPRSTPTTNPTATSTVADLAARLALTPSVGDIIQQTDNSRFYEFLGGSAAIPGNWRDYFATRSIVRVHGDIGKRTLYFKIRRVSAIPNLPDLQAFLNDPNVIMEALDAYDISPAPPIITANGTQKENAVEGWLSYFQERPINPQSEVFQAPSLPWDTTTLANNQLQYAANVDTASGQAII